MLTSSMLTSAPRKKISFKSRILKRRHTETEFPAKKLLFEKIASSSLTPTIWKRA
jgi:hypothetical protein